MRFLLALAFALVGGCGGNRSLEMAPPPDMGADLAPADARDLSSVTLADLAPAVDLSTAPDLGAAMTPDMTTQPDLAPACGHSTQPCCAGYTCTDGSTCLAQGTGVPQDATCIFAPACGGYAEQCCDSGGNPGATSTLGFCYASDGYWCHAGTCLP